MTETRCRSCTSTSLEVVLEYGPTPIADHLLDEQELADVLNAVVEDPVVPLTLMRCSECTLIQIAETVDPELLFRAEYPYFSSVSPSLSAHFERAALEYEDRYELDSSSLVIEIASNDGVLLRHLLARGIPTLGVDPAIEPARAANEIGVETICDFFNVRVAAEIESERGRASLIIANNVVPHVADVHGLLDAVDAALAPDGVFVMECHDVRSLLIGHQWDTVYHQHLSYFSLESAKLLLERHGLSVIDVEEIETYGGSLRIHASRSAAGRTTSSAVAARLEVERTQGLGSPSVATDFAESTRRRCLELAVVVDNLEVDGPIVAWGAAAKATTLLAISGLASRIDCIVDVNPYKWGRFMPGNHLPIIEPGQLAGLSPAAVVILAWNFEREIVAQLSDLLDYDLPVILPIPEARVTSLDVQVQP